MDFSHQRVKDRRKEGILWRAVSADLMGTMAEAGDCSFASC